MAIDGTYKIIAKAPIGKQDGTIVFKTQGDVLTGSMTTMGTEFPIENGKIDGNNFEFTMKFKTPMGSGKSTVTGTVDGDNISGKFKAMLQTMNFSGERAV